MPIYEYRCESCGFQKEFIQRMSDAPLTDCPECAKPTLSKMVTAAGFQLKGSGWYVTDFRNNKTADSKKSSGTTAEKSADTGKSDNVSKSADSAPASASSSSTAPAATPTPAPASGKTA